MTTKTSPHTPLPGNEVEEFAYQRSAAEGYLDKFGREMPSPLPIAPPIGYKKSKSLAEQIREMVLSEKLKMEAMAAGHETFEEADDFDVDDDYDPRSPFEETFDPPLPPPPPSPSPTAAPQPPTGESTAAPTPVDTKTS